jgi:hypothetical protein
MSYSINIKGLWVYKNELAGPEGALTKADNIIIDEQGVAESRRGFKTWGDECPTSIKQLFSYKQKLIRHSDTLLQFDSDGNGTFSDFNGSYSELESGLRIKALESNGNFYFTSIDGIKKISATKSSEFSTSSGYITNAGAVKGLDFETELSGTTGYLEAGNQCAYRIVWGYKDKNSNLILGEPSSRTIIENFATTFDVSFLAQSAVSYTVTFQDTGDTVTLASHGFSANDIVFFTTINTTLGIVISTNYYVVNTTLNTFQLSHTSNGPAIELTDDGNGILYTNPSRVVLATHGLVAGDALTFTSITATQGIAETISYYVINPTINDFQISDTVGGLPLVLTTNGTGTIKPEKDNPSKDVQLTIQIPQEVNSNYFVQIYRTSQITPSTPGNDESGDEMNQVGEIPYDGITNPIIYIDNYLEIFRDNGTILYTNQISGQGILQANSRPPIATDISLFRNSVFYANTKTIHTLSLNLLSATDLDGFIFAVGNSTVVRKYTFQDYDSTTDANPSIVNVDGGIIGSDIGGTPAQNIDTTARNLIKIINKDGSSPITAFYTSLGSTLPGQFTLENKSLADIKFYVCVNDSSIISKFNPELPAIVTINTTTIQTSNIYSDNQVSPNRIYYSKTSQPESVPLVNYIDVGPKDKQIYRILGLRDSLFVLKEDGVYIVTGYSAQNFSVRLLDNTAIIIAPDSAAILNNKIYCLTTQGIVAISETGVEIVAIQIQNLIKDATKNGIDFKTLSFGLGYDSDRSYHLWMPQKSTDTVATQCFRLNTYTEAWVRWTVNATCGIIFPIEYKMYLGDGESNYIIQERKNLDRTDYADKEFTVNILDTGSIQGNDLVLNSVSGINKGDALVQIQYITVATYNQLLKKLDLDAGLTYSLALGGIGYYSSLQMFPGDKLLSKLQALNTMLLSDPTIGTYTTVSFSNDFLTMQIEFNSLITQLNSSNTNTIYKNYRLSVDSIYYESLVLAINTFTNKVTLSQAMPFIYGSEDPLTVYKAISSDIIWNPQHFGEPNSTKQIHEATFIFANNNLYNISAEFMSDLSPDFEEVTYTGKDNGSWGLFTWGSTNWGGNGSETPFRTLIPKNKQKCRYLTPRLVHGNSRSKFRLIGISATPRVISTRGYR